MTNIKAYARGPYGDRAVYGMATACQISTANVEMQKVITLRYNSTATPASVKHRDSPYGGPAATTEFLRQPLESLDFGVLRPPYGRRRVNVTEVYY